MISGVPEKKSSGFNCRSSDVYHPFHQHILFDRHAEPFGQFSGELHYDVTSALL